MEVETAVHNEIQQLKIKRLLEKLETAQGDSTSMISIIVPSGGSISRVSKKLTDEYGTSSVQNAIRSIQAKLKQYRRVPPNGLAIFCGNYKTDTGKEKKINVTLEPLKCINSSMYWCDNRFHTEYLVEQLQSHQKIGFVIIDGNGVSLHTLCGNNRETVHKFDVTLPKKHGRGGQSKQRFERQRYEKRDWYVKKVAALCNQHFIDLTSNKIKVTGLVFAGHADFKLVLSKCIVLDPRLKKSIIRLVDIQYGGITGLNEAVRLCEDVLSDLKYIKEKKLLSSFFTEIASDGNVCYGLQDTCFGLEAGVINQLLLWENFPGRRYTLRSKIDNKETVFFTANKETPLKQLTQEPDKWELVKNEPMIEWVLDKFPLRGYTVEFVSDQSPEGSQFVKGFGGICAVLKYNIVLPSSGVYEDEVEEVEYEY